MADSYLTTSLFANIYYKGNLLNYIGVKLVWPDVCWVGWIDEVRNDSYYNEIIQQGYYYAENATKYDRHSTKHLIKPVWWCSRNQLSSCCVYLLADAIGNVYITEYVYDYIEHLRNRADSNLKKLLSTEVHKERCVNVILYADSLGLIGDIAQLIKQFAVQSITPYDEKAYMAKRLVSINWHGE